MPRNKKEGIIYGVCMCALMVYCMVLFNVCINMGVNLNAIGTSFIAFVPVFAAAMIIENLIVGRLNEKVLACVLSEKDSLGARTVVNAVSMVLMMSLIMTIVGSVIGGESLGEVLSEYFVRWPRNFCCALFVNLAVATPLSRFVLKTLRLRKRAAA